jgi:hypothetical protein
MAVTEHASGTQTATIATEHFLGTDPDSTDGAFQFVVDLSNMANADDLEIRVYEAALSSDVASQQVHMWPIKDAQADDLFISPALVLLHRWRFSIKQVAGTGRSFKWSIRRVA